MLTFAGFYTTRKAVVLLFYMRKRTLLLLLLFLTLVLCAILAFAEESRANPPNSGPILDEARTLLLEKDVGAASLVKEAAKLLFLGTAWEGKARIMFRQAVAKSEQASLLVSPLLDEANPYPPSTRALACWIKGNAKSFKMAASLRILKGEETAGKTHQELGENVREIFDAYKCALRQLESEEARNTFGPDQGRFQEIIRKNLPVLKKIEEKQKKKITAQPVEPEDEKEILTLLLGRSLEKGDQERILVPPREPDIGKEYSPGSVGTH